MMAEAALHEGWYISRDGEMEGPLADSEMRAAIGRGAVKPEHLVWREGMELWVEAREIPNFNELRKAHLDAAVAEGREKSRDRIKAQKPWSDRASEPRAPAPAPWSVRVDRTAARPTSDRPESKAQPTDGGGTSPLPGDLDKLAKEYLGKLEHIPMGAIAFVVLGLIFTPLLPIFWFIAWRIWSKSKS